MIATRNARKLTRYNAWANREIFEAVAVLPEGEATRARSSLFSNTVRPDL